jgi:hypothetical protein
MLRRKKRGFDRLARVHEQRHINFSYIRIDGCFIIFSVFLKGVAA